MVEVEAPQDEDIDFLDEIDWENLSRSIADFAELQSNPGLVDPLPEDFLVHEDASIEQLKQDELHQSPVSDPVFGEVENFLLEDNEQIEVNQDFCDDFFADVLPDVSDARFGEERSSNDESSTPGTKSVSEEEEKEKDEIPEANDRSENDPISKKRKRQMRNRDSAMKSRERKKLYVRDLEMKSKFLETECRRLEMALQCCMAENQILHHRLGAFAAKQESAVLLMESLLLGSLFWLASIVCLFILAGAKMVGEMGKGGGRGCNQVLELVVKEVEKVGNEELALRSGLTLTGRRCKSTKKKMKEQGLLALPAVFG